MPSDLIQDHVVDQVTLRRKFGKIKIILLSGLRTKLSHAEWLLGIHIVVLERTDQGPLNLLYFDLREHAAVPRALNQLDDVQLEVQPLAQLAH